MQRCSSAGGIELDDRQIFYVDGGASIMDTVFPLEIQDRMNYPARVCRKAEIKGMAPG